ESARGSRQGETPGIFIVLSGFATTDLSVRFCDAYQGGEAYGKTPVGRGLVVLFLVFRYAFRLRYLSLRKIRPLAADK
ncbi:hypothetical protein NL313_27320, partial [Klebsiella pneumoniae]|nr:hypothetical protein [Klebsiella pneumoniae]